MNLEVSFEQKDEAKRLGAQWDPARKTWYLRDVEDLTPFMRWIAPTRRSMRPNTPAGTASPAPKVWTRPPEAFRAGRFAS